MRMAKGDDIGERLVEFAVAAMDLADEAPESPAGSHLSGQLLRSATAAAPDYAEARGADGSRDFLHKLGLALKELNESKVWLDMVLRRRTADEEATPGYDSSALNFAESMLPAFARQRPNLGVCGQHRSLKRKAGF
jgi:four helix bundle protein